MAAGLPTAILSHNGAIPLETLNWIVQNGPLGFALVALVVVGSFAMLQLRERNRIADAAADKREALLREMLELTRSVTTSQDMTREALGRAVEIFKQFEGEEPL